MNKFIYFITGASGVGKTTLIDRLREKNSNNDRYEFLHFDSIGIPSVDKMIKECGTIEKWQEKKTNEWIDKLIDGYEDKEVIFFEGQVRMNFIKDAFLKHKFKNYKIIHVDCSEEEMVYRLTHKRGQPELLSDDMKNWLKFLRNQAKELNITSIDTTGFTDGDLLREFEEVVKMVYISHKK